MNEKPHPSNGLSLKLPIDTPTLKNEHKEELETKVSQLRMESQIEVMRHAHINQVATQVEQIEITRKHVAIQMVNDFVENLGDESELMMVRSSHFNDEIGTKIDQAEMKMKLLIQNKREELQREVNTGIISVQEFNEYFESFKERQHAKFQRMNKLGNRVMSTVDDLFESAIDKVEDSKPKT